MISLTSTVTDAMRSRQGRPCVRAVVMDKEWRWASVLETEGSALQTAARVIGDGSLMRARITAAGKVEVQTVTLPNVGASWQSPWTEIAADAMSGSDVAIGWENGGSKVRVFWVKLDAGTYYLRYAESADNGSTWGALMDVFSTADVIGSVAASRSVVIYVRGTGVRLMGRDYSGGAWWGGGSAWVAGGTLAEDSGLAVEYDSGGSSYEVIVCGKWGDDRRLRIGHWKSVGGWSGSVADVVPPGLPAADFRPRWPSMVNIGGVRHLSFLDTYTGTPAYSMVVVMRSSDYEHWGCACGVNLTWDTLQRANVVYYSTTEKIYAAMDIDVVGAPEYDAADSGRKMTETEVLFYQKDVGDGYGYLFVDIHNPDHKYDNFGESGEDGEAMKLLSEVVIERGYRTSAGYEYVASQPFYLVKVSHRVGIGRPALRLVAVDGWGLMGRWEADQSYHWSGKTVEWLITEIVSRSSGLACEFCASTEWATVMAEFALNPLGWMGLMHHEAQDTDREVPVLGASSTAINAVNSLFRKVGGRGWWDQNGVLQCLIPANQSTVSTYTYGTNSEIIKGEYAVAVITPNVVRVMGDGAGYQVAHLSDGQDLGRRLIDIAVDLHLDAASECQAMATGLWDDAVARAYDGYLEVHLNPGVELWDIVSVTDARTGYSSEKRRISGVYEVWNSVKRRYSSLLRLEGT
ncbi:MAG: hypothetical protein ABIK79_14330 [Chloroflexota bacterium]